LRFVLYNVSDVNKDLGRKDKDLTRNDKDKDLTRKDKDQDLTRKDKDKYLSSRTRTRTRTWAQGPVQGLPYTCS
jgi:hypothetical protein